MKPAQAKAHKERIAAVNIRRWARRIPDNSVLINLLLKMEKPLRADFLRCVSPHLKFKPVSLEVIDAN